MAKYTKIPEMDIPGALTKALSPIIGDIRSKVQDEIDKATQKMDDMAKKAFLEAREQGSRNLKCLSAYEGLDSINNSLNTADSTISKLESTIKGLEASMKALTVPIKGLKASILVIKAIPLPQTYLPVNVTTVFSDTLEMLSELVAQTEEMSDQSLMVLDSMSSSLTDTKTAFTKINPTLSALKADRALHCSLSEATAEDLQELKNLGVFDNNGDSIFNKLGSNAAESGYLSFGQVQISFDELVKLKYLLENKQISLLALNELLSKGKEKRSLEIGENEILIEKVETWYMDISTAIECLLGKSDKEDIRNYTILGKVSVVTIGDVLSGKELDNSVLLLSSNADVKDLLEHILNKIDKAAYISSTVKDSIENLITTIHIDKEGSVEIRNREGYYVSPINGQLFKIEVLPYEKSKTGIAMQHYAQVTDESGTVVLTGEPSFTLDFETLIEESKVRLSQLFI